MSKNNQGRLWKASHPLIGRIPSAVAWQFKALGSNLLFDRVMSEFESPSAAFLGWWNLAWVMETFGGKRP